MRWLSSEKILSLKDFTLPQLRLFLKGYPGDWRGDPDEAFGKPPPPIEKAWPEDASLIGLPSPEDNPAAQAPYARLVADRRSCRSFSNEAVSPTDLGFLLWSSQAITAIAKTADGEVDHHLRVVPSGGACHPFETYVLAERVDGISPGLYRYIAGSHALLSLGGKTNPSRRTAEACYGQAFIETAAVAVVWAAVPYRTEWRYGYIAHRMIAMEAGHLCQNFLLSAEALHLGSCPVLGYDQKAMDELIEVDGTNEFTVYLAVVGRRP